jgi:EthD domain
MVKVTVLYNLPPGSDEEAFIAWRMTTHHEQNIARPGVVRSDFYRLTGTPLLGPERPATQSPPFRFMTEAYYETMESFEASWNDPEEQARLLPAVEKIADAVFLVSEEMQTYVAPYSRRPRAR